MTTTKSRGWIIDITLGVIGGGVAGAILAVNIVIFAGPDQGYESSLSSVFAHSMIAGVATVLALVGTPILGVALFRQFRARLEKRQTSPADDSRP